MSALFTTASLSLSLSSVGMSRPVWSAPPATGGSSSSSRRSTVRSTSPLVDKMAEVATVFAGVTKAKEEFVEQVGRHMPRAKSAGRLHGKDRNTMFLNHYKDPNPILSGVWSLVLRWKGSVFKLVLGEILAFSLGYSFLSLLYRFVLFNHPYSRELFELICVWSNRFSNLIPIAFLTGFYVTQVVTRWWDQFMSLPFPDKVAVKLCAFVPGQDTYHRNLRRTVMRYLNVSTTLVYRLVSEPVRERFPDYDALVHENMLLPNERDRLNRADALIPHETTMLPIVWATSLLQEARAEGRIDVEGPIFANLILSIDYITDCNRKLLNYGWVNFPLVYTQVAAISVLMYFVAALFARQYLIPRTDSQDEILFPHLNISYSSVTPFDNHTPDFYIPVFTFVELLSYMGWIKVAETLLNPFGDDDEDFQISYLIDRNLHVSYMIVDEAEEGIEMAKDPGLYDDEPVRRRIPNNNSNNINRDSTSSTSSNVNTISSNSTNTISISSISGGGGGGGGQRPQLGTAGSGILHNGQAGGGGGGSTVTFKE